ncbi:hypothetical protein A4D02_21685 [Niastella koreensis]|uniref:Uncharacterized protein n=2 Tax=Niastella koreensis TaxID=354356 RepID=G8THU6_NIAKG|nr:hypothetical protein [Niastella koreensis]AEV98541.1 hypothetical protein Niako_2186 [Niastella koreensis GR20-10]OQP53016.1 hypothetical protein A4D02_21685 [Niastella koreensis]
MRFLLLSLLLGLTGVGEAQLLTGVWGGIRTQNVGGCFPEYSTELHIIYMQNNAFIGNVYSYDNDRYTKINFSGRYNPLTKRMVIIENSVLQYNVPDSCIPCIKTYELTFSKNGEGNELLQGEWRGHEMGNNNNCQPGKISLARVAKSIFPVDVYQNDTLARLQKNLKLKKRDKDLVQTLTIDTSFLKIELYDNAEIDDDTVTVFLNNTMLLYQKRLTGKPLVLNVTAFPNTEYELMMYADNLGRIPPNTALMVITAGRKRYQLHLSSSEEKSAVVRFKYEPKSQ